MWYTTWYWEYTQKIWNNKLGHITFSTVYSLFSARVDAFYICRRSRHYTYTLLYSVHSQQWKYTILCTKFFCHSVLAAISPVSTSSHFTSLSSPILNTLNMMSMHCLFASHIIDIKRCRWPGSMSDNWWLKKMGCMAWAHLKEPWKTGTPIYHQNCSDWLTDLQTEWLCFCAMCYVFFKHMAHVCKYNSHPLLHGTAQ